MKKIEGELNTPYQKEFAYITGDFENSFKQEIRSKWKKFGGTVNRVRSSEGYPVKNFRQLIDEIALVTISNTNYEMYYRGQSKDYLNNQAIYFSANKKKSIIYPSICRPEKNKNGSLKYSIRKDVISERYEKLYSFIEYINKVKDENRTTEYYMSLFQHYEIFPTPLIDITQSLRVAATFALRENNFGYVYVFGLPYPNQSISYFTDLGIILLKLQNIVGVRDIRPRYQEGYLVGKFPFAKSKTQSDDLSNRMIAKFLVDNRDGTFWDESFIKMPDDILYPPNDPIVGELFELKRQFEAQHKSLTSP